MKKDWFKSLTVKFASLAMVIGCAALTANAGGFDGKSLTTNDWFDVGFSGVADNTAIVSNSTTGISLGAGSWTAVPDGDAIVSNGELSFDADDENLLTLTPTASSATGMETVAVKVKATAVTTELETPSDSPIAMFALHSDGSAVAPVAYVAGGWTNLVYTPGAANLTNAWFTLYIDFADVSGTKYVRYSVEPQGGALTVLKDSQDETWFKSASSATKISTLSFSGSGLCKTISGDTHQSAVAQVNGVNYATFNEAITAAGGTYDINVLDNSAALPAGWKIADGKLVPIVYVAQIGANQYESIQAAVDAAYEMTGNVTITLLTAAAEKVDITQKAGLSLTIDGDGKTLTGQLRVTDDSANDTARTGALTIKGFNFTGTADDVTTNESYIFFERNAYAHNIVVTNCTFTSIDVATAKSGRPAVKGLAQGLETITLVDLQAQNVHSLAQLFDVTNAVITKCNLSAAKSGININFGGAASGNNGVATISDSTISPDVSGSYGVRLQGTNYGTLRLLDGTYLTATDAIVGGNTAPTAPSYTGSIVVEGGYYSGNITRPVEGYNYSITGGYFSVAPDASFIAEGYEVVANDDAETSATYPWKVGAVPVDPYASLGTKVADGFYQNAATYAASTDFYITNLNGLKYFRDLVNGDETVCAGYPELPRNRTIHAFSGKTVHLLADIDLNNESWEPIGYAYQTNERWQFEGSFDGGIYDELGNLTGTHIISNLNVSISSGKYYAGLFGVYHASANSTLKNLTLDGVTISSGQSAQGVGAFVGSAKNAQAGVTLENLHVIGSISIVGSSTSYVGGIVGDGRCTIRNCSVAAEGTIKGTYNVGGIAGGILTSSTGMYDCAVTNVTVQASSYNYGLGALAGFSRALNVSNCTASAVTVVCNVSSYSGSGQVGLLVGFPDSTSAYTILSDNTVVNTTATEYNTAVTTQIGAKNKDYAIVGANIAYDGSGKINGGVFQSLPTAVIADGLSKIANTDPATSAEYPYTVGIPQVAQIVRNDAVLATYATLAAAINTAQDGDTIELLMNITLSGTDFVEINKVGTYTIDGKGFSITPADDSAYTYHRFMFGASGQAYTATKNFIVKNLTISGFTNSTYFIRSEGCCVTFEDCTIANNTLAGQANSRLILNSHADFTLDGCTIVNNTSADSLIDFNSNASGSGTNALVVSDCLITGNTNGGVAVIQIAEDRTVRVTDSTFEGNTVNATNNGAVVYFGSQGGDCTGCLFKDNVINYTTTSGYDNRVRVAGAIFTWARGDNPGTISGNAFVNNSVVKQNEAFLTCYAKSIYSGGYYNAQDLPGNYFGGSAPVIGQADTTTAGNDIYAEYGTQPITASSYATSYAINDGGRGVSVVIPVFVAQIGDEKYTTLAAAIAAAQDGDTIELLCNIELSGTTAVEINKVGTYTIDGKGYSITPAEDCEYVHTRFKFGMDSYAYTDTKRYIVKDLTISGFGADATYFIRAEGCSLALVDCTVTDNGISEQSGSRLFVITDADLTLNGCEISDNESASYLLDFNTNGQANKTGGTLNIDNCLFDGNTAGESGIVYSYGSISGNDVIQNTTFTDNTVSSAAAAVIYFSGATDVTGCLFQGNVITASDATQKCGVLALGSGAAGSDYVGNAFVDNTVTSSGNAATIYVGATNVVLTANYWGAGNAPTTGNGADLYLGKTEGVDYGSFAYAYAVNANGCGVTVVLGKIVTFEGAAPDGVADFALPTPNPMSYPVGSPAEVALPLPAYTSESVSFAGWQVKNSNPAVILSRIPASSDTDFTLVATWAGTKTVEVITIDGGGTSEDQTASIKVTDEWVVNNVTNKVGETATTEEIQAALNTEEANGNKAWENYVLGLDGSDPNAKVTADVAQGSDISATPVTSNIKVPEVDTGFKVQYKLEKVEDVAGTNPQTAVAAQDSAVIPIDLEQMEGSVAYYKTTAVITSNDESSDVHVEVESDNVVGVLKVENAPSKALIAVPWDSLDGNADGVLVADLVRTANLSDGDELHVYVKSTETYLAWVLDNGAWSPMLNFSDSQPATMQADAATTRVPRGSAVWLTRQNSSEPVYLVGQASDVPVTKTELAPATSTATSTEKSWNLVANPTVESKSVQTILGSGSTNDQIIVPTDGAPKNYVYNEEKGEWGYYDVETYTTTKGKTRVRSVWVKATSSDTIPAGTGFWYLNSSTDENSKIEW